MFFTVDAEQRQPCSHNSVASFIHCTHSRPLTSWIFWLTRSSRNSMIFTRVSFVKTLDFNRPGRSCKEKRYDFTRWKTGTKTKGGGMQESGLWYFVATHVLLPTVLNLLLSQPVMLEYSTQLLI